VDVEEWRAQLPQFRQHFAQFDNLPPELVGQLDALEQRLG
jgi:GTP-dependent phosphoenolpyruvate carboxykinase